MPRKTTQAGPFVITANALVDGRVVYHSIDGSWTPAITEAAIYPDVADASATLEAIRLLLHSSSVIDPQAIAVTAEMDGIRPDSLRERIRSLGPSQNWTKTDISLD
jgi:hypothetical protein